MEKRSEDDEPERQAPMNCLLVAIGTVLIVAGLGNWFIPEELGSSVVRETNTASRTVEKFLSSPKLNSTIARRRGNQARSGSGSEAKVVTSNPADRITHTDPPLGSRRSETMSLALIGFGFLSVLVGSAWPRILSITGPGGVGVTFAALSSVSDATSQQEERLKVLETTTERINSTVELLVRQLIQASKEE